MGKKTQIITVDTARFNTFAVEAQRAFVAVCLHIDWLLNQTQLPIQHKIHPGSDSWMLQKMATDPKVVIKALPWDRRMSGITIPYTRAEAGVIIMLRDDFLTKENMRVLSEEYGDFYLPCPSAPLYSVAPQRDKAFQMILIPLGPGCNLFDLPGVDEYSIEMRILKRLTDGKADKEEVSNAPSDAPDGQSELSPELQIDMNRIVVTLGEILQRAM